MIDLSISELETSILDTLDRVIASAPSPGWTVDDGRCAKDEALWRTLSELTIFDASLANDGITFVTSALVAERLGATLVGLPLIDHCVAMRLLERLDPGAAVLRDEVVQNGWLLALAVPARSAGAPSMSAAIADRIFMLGVDGGIGCIVPGHPGAAFANLADLPLANVSAEHGEAVRFAVDPVAVADALAERKVLIAAALGGMSARAVELAADYAKERVLFGTPIGGFQSLSHGMANGKVYADAIQLLTREAAWARSEAIEEFDRLASMAYAFAVQGSLEATRFAMHVFGGYGVTREYPVQAYFRTAKALALLGGDARAELRKIGANILDAAAVGSPRQES